MSWSVFIRGSPLGEDSVLLLYLGTNQPHVARVIYIFKSGSLVGAAEVAHSARGTRITPTPVARAVNPFSR